MFDFTQNLCLINCLSSIKVRSDHMFNLPQTVEYLTLFPIFAIKDKLNIYVNISKLLSKQDLSFICFSRHPLCYFFPTSSALYVIILITFVAILMSTNNNFLKFNSTFIPCKVKQLSSKILKLKSE